MKRKTKWFGVVGALLLLALSAHYSRGGTSRMDTAAQEQKIERILDSYVKAVNGADADLLESLFWTADPRFSEVENDRGKPLGAREFHEISDWIRQHAKPGNKQRFYNTKVYFLTPEVAYSVSMRDELDVKKTSRVTLIYLKRGEEWRIIHGHFSYVPD